MNVQFTDNSDEILREFKASTLRALEQCGQEAQGYAVDLAPVDTGNPPANDNHGDKDLGELSMEDYIAACKKK